MERYSYFDLGFAIKIIPVILLDSPFSKTHVKGMKKFGDIAPEIFDVFTVFNAIFFTP